MVSLYLDCGCLVLQPHMMNGRVDWSPKMTSARYGLMAPSPPKMELNPTLVRGWECRIGNLGTIQSKYDRPD